MTMMLDLMPRFRITSMPMRKFFEGWMDPYNIIEERSDWVPASEITEREKEYVATIELPGVSMEGLDISYKEGVLTIKGEKKNGLEENECCHCSERFSGSFHRDLFIPGKIVEDKIEATLKNGILRIVLPKSEESIVKRIEIH